MKYEVENICPKCKKECPTTSMDEMYGSNNYYCSSCNYYFSGHPGGPRPVGD